MKVGIIYGGYSTEKYASAENANYIAEALRKRQYDVYMFEYSLNLIEKLQQKQIDIVYLCVQGKGHGDGTLQAMLDHEHIPYTGSKMQAASLINDKILCKFLFEYYQIKTPAWKILSLEQYTNGTFAYDEIGFPFVAKAPSQGGSFGIALIHNAEELYKIENIFTYDNPILLEQFIIGKFYTVGVIEKEGRIQNLKCVEGIQIKENLEETKADEITVFTGDYSARLPQLSSTVIAKMEEDAKKIFEITKAEDVARVDFMLSDADGLPYALEINAVPGLKPQSLLPRAAAFSEMNYETLIEGILLSAWNKTKNKEGMMHV